MVDGGERGEIFKSQMCYTFVFLGCIGLHIFLLAEMWMHIFVGCKRWCWWCWENEEFEVNFW